MAKTLKEQIEDRLTVLRISPEYDGRDAGMLDIFSYLAMKEVSEITGMKTLPSELIYSVADIAAADFADSVLMKEEPFGATSSRSDGDISVHYIRGTTEYEKTAEMIAKMRARGVDSAKKYRRIRW